MKLYHMYSAINHPEAMVDFEKNANDIFAFFKMNMGDDEKIRKRKLNFIAQSGYKLDNIVKTDYLQCTSALLFSRQFYNKIGEYLKDEMQFFPCSVFCQGVEFEWYAVKILRQISAIDIEKSGCYKLSNNDVMLDSFKYKRNIVERFYIARDNHQITDFVVSELFVSLCNTNNISIEFEEVHYSY